MLTNVIENEKSVYEKRKQFGAKERIWRKFNL